MSKPKHILVIRLSAMGDVAMTVPVLRALVLQHPEVRITVVSRPFFAPFFKGIQNVAFFGVDLNSRHKGFVGLLRLYSDLRKLKIDAVADLHNVLRSQVVRNLFALSGKQVAATDKGRADKKALTRANNKIFVPIKPMVKRHCDTFAELGLAVDMAEPVFPHNALLTEAIIKITGEKKEKWIGIAPFAQYQSKVYPQDLMQLVVNNLAADLSNKILLFGGGAREVAILNEMKQQHSNAIVIAGKLNLQQELDLISNLDVMLSMDSGNAHIAAMLGVKVITLWGATHPYAGFLPFNQSLENALTADRDKYPLLPTSVYGNKKVEGYDEAMRTISPEMVINKIKRSLTK